MRHRNLPLHALSIFEAAARHQSFTRAGDELHLTQSAVSKQIAQLEAHLGYPLFHRYPRSLKLSSQGSALLGYVQRVFDILDKGIDAAAAINTPLHIKAPSCVARWLLAQLRDFAAVAPDIAVQVSGVHDHNIDFSREDFDMAIVYQPLNRLEDDALLLFAEQLTPILSPRLQQQTGQPLATPAQLSHYPLLHPSRDRRDWRQWLAHHGERSVDYRSGTVFDTLDQAMNAALQGFGVTLGDVTLLADELKYGQVRAPFQPPWHSGHGYALRLRDEPSAAAITLRSWFAANPVSAAQM